MQDLQQIRSGIERGTRAGAYTSRRTAGAAAAWSEGIWKTASQCIYGAGAAGKAGTAHQLCIQRSVHQAFWNCAGWTNHNSSKKARQMRGLFHFLPGRQSRAYLVHGETMHRNDRWRTGGVQALTYRRKTPQKSGGSTEIDRGKA